VRIKPALLDCFAVTDFADVADEIVNVFGHGE
jgi:hypothetical protein